MLGIDAIGGDFPCTESWRSNRSTAATRGPNSEAGSIFDFIGPRHSTLGSLSAPDLARRFVESRLAVGVGGRALGAIRHLIHFRRVFAPSISPTRHGCRARPAAMTGIDRRPSTVRFLDARERRSARSIQRRVERFSRRAAARSLHPRHRFRRRIVGLHLDGRLVVDNGGRHPRRLVSGSPLTLLAVRTHSTCCISRIAASSISTLRWRATALRSRPCRRGRCGLAGPAASFGADGQPGSERGVRSRARLAAIALFHRGRLRGDVPEDHWHVAACDSGASCDGFLRDR